MKLTTKLWLAVVVSCTLLCGLSAQETVNLSAQRKESQHVNLIPGKKLEHRGIVINPTPQQVSVDTLRLLDVTAGVCLKDKQGCFTNDLDFLKQHKRGVGLTIDFGTKQSAKYGVKPLSGAYLLTIRQDGIKIVGYDEQGAFYGLQTLRQLVESPIASDGKLPFCTINDYPSLSNRGVVEGFYGTPWAHQTRLSLIDFYGKFKLNTYIFGPKDDPYHSSPHWREPYPLQESRQISELVQACRRNRVNFVWAIHPGKDIKWNEEDFRNLITKFEAMYQLGVRSFAIFFDDISGEGTDPAKQSTLLNRLVTDFIQVKGDVQPLIFCPTDYTRSWANPTPQGSLPLFGKTLHPSIRVFWTGDAVCSDVTKSTLEWVNSRIKRPAFSWWNYPVTDYVRHLVLQGPVYGLDTTLKEGADFSGLVSNPMEHGEASKLALYSVADYCWNIPAYNPIDSWERALVELAGEAGEAYRTFAIHSGDTGTGYRRDESWETYTFDAFDYTDGEYDALLQEFLRIERVAGTMERTCLNKPLLNELRPWLTEFSRLGVRGRKALELLKLYEAGNPAAFWEAYTRNLMSHDERIAFEAHSSGTYKLQPFYENVMDAMLIDFYKKLTGYTPSIPKAVGSYFNLKTPPYKLMFDNDSTTYYTSGRTQKTNQWVGVDLGSVRDIYEVHLLQGRNSVDDVDYFDHAVLEYSVDGEEWLPLTEEFSKRYIIHWEEASVKGRYVRLRKLPSAKRNWIAIRTFAINPVKAEKLGFRVEAPELDKALLVFDKHPGTSYLNKGCLSFDVPEGVKEVTILSKSSTVPMVVKQIAADGSVLAVTMTTAAYCPLALSPQAERVEVEGERELMEVAF